MQPLHQNRSMKEIPITLQQPRHSGPVLGCPNASIIVLMEPDTRTANKLQLHEWERVRRGRPSIPCELQSLTRVMPGQAGQARQDEDHRPLHNYPPEGVCKKGMRSGVMHSDGISRSDPGRASQTRV